MHPAHINHLIIHAMQFLIQGLGGVLGGFGRVLGLEPICVLNLVLGGVGGRWGGAFRVHADGWCGVLGVLGAQLLVWMFLLTGCPNADAVYTGFSMTDLRQYSQLPPSCHLQVQVRWLMLSEVIAKLVEGHASTAGGGLNALEALILLPLGVAA